MANFEFKPFDKVLVRNRWSMWIPAFYGMKSESKHLTSAGWQDECIPYEGNEEYLGTSNNYVDKVSKLKVGDWLCHTVYKKPLLIVEDLGKGFWVTEPKSIITAKEFREGLYRLWTIQDAKDGDILYAKIGDEEWLYLYNNLIDDPDFLGLLEKSWINNYCCYRQNDGWFSYEKQEAYPVNEYSIISPATKEQHDTLMKVMADAGYTFDFDKKELKNIEQEPTWSEKYIADVFEKVGLAKIVREQSNDNLTNTLQDAMIELAKYSVVPQPKQEWSEEDEKDFNTAIQHIENYVNNTPSSQRPEIWADITKLKSLRPQSQWKLSDEQIKVCKEVYADLLSAKGFDLGTVNSELNRLEEELKKLKG